MKLSRLALFLLLLAIPQQTAHAQSPFDKAALAWSLPWDADWVTAVSFVGPNRLAAGNNLGQILIWDLPEKPEGPAPKPIRRLDGHSNTITNLITTPEGRLLISASNDHAIRVWDPHAPGTKKGTVILNAKALAEAEVKKKKVPSTKTPVPNEVPVEMHESVKILTGHQEWVTGLSLNKDGTMLASGDEKGEVVIWDFQTGKEQRRWKVKGWIWALALSPQAESLLISERYPLVFDSGRYVALKIWNRDKAEVTVDLSKTFEKQVIAWAAYSPDGKHLAIGRGGESDGTSGKVTLLDPTTGKTRKELTPGHLNGLTHLIFHPDGKHLVTSGRDTTVRIWDVEQGKVVKELGQPRGGQFKDWIHAVAVSPDGRWLAAADMAGMVQVYALGGK